MKTLIAGIGSPILGDDGVGVHVARRLATRALPADVVVVELGTAGLSLLDHLEGHDRLILVDAILSGAAPGTLHVLEGDAVRKTAHLGSSHEADLPTTLEVGRQTLRDRMPSEVVVLAVEVAELTRFTERLTPAVEAAVPVTVARILALLESG